MNDIIKDFLSENFTTKQFVKSSWIDWYHPDRRAAVRSLNHNLSYSINTFAWCS